MNPLSQLRRLGRWIAWTVGPELRCVACGKHMTERAPINVDGYLYHNVECWMDEIKIETPEDYARKAGL